MIKKDEGKLRVIRNRMKRSIMKVKISDRTQIKQIKKKLGQKEDFVMAAKR